MTGESIHWAGMPDPRVIFHSDDWAAIPFSLIWTGFFVFCEAQAFGFWGAKPQRDGNLFMELWGIPFLVMGNYFVWGRFLQDAWLKRRPTTPSPIVVCWCCKKGGGGKPV